MQLQDFTAKNWSQVWGVSLIPPDQNRYTRIICPILLSSPVIAVLFSIPSFSHDAWRWGGYVSREITLGLTLDVSTARLDESRKLYVNRLQVFTYTAIVENYSLVFDAAISGNVQLSVWEYTGLIT